jgi:hypothetical protein
MTHPHASDDGSQLLLLLLLGHPRQRFTLC